MPIDIGPQELGAETEQLNAVVIPQFSQNGRLSYFDLDDFKRLLIRPDEKLGFVNVEDAVRHQLLPLFS
jgi:hypothetical protein